MEISGLGYKQCLGESPQIVLRQSVGSDRTYLRMQIRTFTDDVFAFVAVDIGEKVIITMIGLFDSDIGNGISFCVLKCDFAGRGRHAAAFDHVMVDTGFYSRDPFLFNTVSGGDGSETAE